MSSNNSSTRVTRAAARKRAQTGSDRGIPTTITRDNTQSPGLGQNVASTSGGKRGKSNSKKRELSSLASNDNDDQRQTKVVKVNHPSDSSYNLNSSKQGGESQTLGSSSEQQALQNIEEGEDAASAGGASQEDQHRNEGQGHEELEVGGQAGEEVEVPVPPAPPVQFHLNLSSGPALPPSQGTNITTDPNPSTQTLTSDGHYAARSIRVDEVPDLTDKDGMDCDRLDGREGPQDTVHVARQQPVSDTLLNPYSLIGVYFNDKVSYEVAFEDLAGLTKSAEELEVVRKHLNRVRLVKAKIVTMVQEAYDLIDNGENGRDIEGWEGEEEYDDEVEEYDDDDDDSSPDGMPRLVRLKGGGAIHPFTREVLELRDDFDEKLQSLALSRGIEFSRALQIAGLYQQVHRRGFTSSLWSVYEKVLPHKERQVKPSSIDYEANYKELSTDSEELVAKKVANRAQLWKWYEELTLEVDLQVPPERRAQSYITDLRRTANYIGKHDPSFHMLAMVFEPGTKVAVNSATNRLITSSSDLRDAIQRCPQNVSLVWNYINAALTVRHFHRDYVPGANAVMNLLEIDRQNYPSNILNVPVIDNSLIAGDAPTPEEIVRIYRALHGQVAAQSGSGTVGGPVQGPLNDAVAAQSGSGTVGGPVQGPLNDAAQSGSGTVGGPVQGPLNDAAQSCIGTVDGSVQGTSDDAVQFVAETADVSNHVPPPSKKSGKGVQGKSKAAASKKRKTNGAEAIQCGGDGDETGAVVVDEAGGTEAGFSALWNNYLWSCNNDTDGARPMTPDRQRLVDERKELCDKQQSKRTANGTNFANAVRTAALDGLKDDIEKRKPRIKAKLFPHRRVTWSHLPSQGFLPEQCKLVDWPKDVPTFMEVNPKHYNPVQLRALAISYFRGFVRLVEWTNEEKMIPKKSEEWNNIALIVNDNGKALLTVGDALKEGSGTNGAGGPVGLQFVPVAVQNGAINPGIQVDRRDTQFQTAAVTEAHRSRRLGTPSENMIGPQHRGMSQPDPSQSQQPEHLPPAQVSVDNSNIPAEGQYGSYPYDSAYNLQYYGMPGYGHHTESHDNVQYRNGTSPSGSQYRVPPDNGLTTIYENRVANFSSAGQAPRHVGMPPMPPRPARENPSNGQQNGLPAPVSSVVPLSGQYHVQQHADMHMPQTRYLPPQLTQISMRNLTNGQSNQSSTTGSGAATPSSEYQIQQHEDMTQMAYLPSQPETNLNTLEMIESHGFMVPASAAATSFNSAAVRYRQQYSDMSQMGVLPPNPAEHTPMQGQPNGPSPTVSGSTTPSGDYFA